MPTSSHDSGTSIPWALGAEDTLHPGEAEGAPPSGGQPMKEPAVWLDGDVLACACPDCHALMSIRAWLMIGDCTRCGTSVELTAEQEEEVLRLLAEREAAAAAPAVALPAPAPPAPQPKPRPAPQAAPARPAPAPAPQVRRPPPLPPAAPPAPARAPLPKFEDDGHWYDDLLAQLPAWLISLVVHVALMMLLGLWVIEEKHEGPQIALSAIMGSKHIEGERGQLDPKRDEVRIEAPGKPPEAQSPQAVAEAKRDAAELHVPRHVADPTLPPVSRVLNSLAAPTKQRMFQGRDPRIRATVVEAEGGTTYTEAAVARGLRWIAKHQSPDGSWSLHNFNHAGDCNGQCGNQGQDSDTAATALALLPMLGAGQTHLHGRYTEQVSKGLRWLIERQLPDGDLRGPGVGRMYAHGQAAIVLCEAFALTGDEQLRGPAQRAINYIVAAQHPEGGWRYSPGEPGDTSVVGWQLMALHSARRSQLDVPDETLDRAGDFLERVRRDDIGATYAYQPGAAATPTMTAEALLCRQYLGWPANQPGLREGVALLVRDQLPRRDAANIYYWYYATQVMHHLGGEPWEKWNTALRETLVPMQETQGHAAGSWTPVGGAIGDHDTQAGGRIYMTSLAICTLEVYYRHLPLYRTLEISDK